MAHLQRQGAAAGGGRVAGADAERVDVRVGDVDQGGERQDVALVHLRPRDRHGQAGRVVAGAHRGEQLGRGRCRGPVAGASQLRPSSSLNWTWPPGAASACTRRPVSTTRARGAAWMRASRAVTRAPDAAGLDGVEGAVRAVAGGAAGGGGLQRARVEQRHPHLPAQGGRHRRRAAGVDLAAHRGDEALVEGGAVVAARRVLQRQRAQVVAGPRARRRRRPGGGRRRPRRRCGRPRGGQGVAQAVEVDREVDVVRQAAVDDHRQAVGLAQAVAGQLAGPVGEGAARTGRGRTARRRSPAAAAGRRRPRGRSPAGARPGPGGGPSPRAGRTRPPRPRRGSSRSTAPPRRRRASAATSAAIDPPTTVRPAGQPREARSQCPGREVLLRPAG